MTMRTTTAAVPQVTVVPRPWIWLALPTAFALSLYAPMFKSLVQEWATFPSFSHGFAVPLVAAYLVWVRRHRLAATALTPCTWGWLILPLGLGGLVLGVRGAEPFLMRISLPVTLLGLSVLLAGLQVTRHVWPAIIYLVFMVPPPWTIVKLAMYRSRLFDAAVAARLLDWVGVPVYRDGVLLQLPTVTLEVADACSSIPAIAALVSLGVAYACLGRKRLSVRLALILMTLPFAIGSNIIRITGTAASVHYIGAWTLNTSVHAFSGTANFLLTFLFLLSFDALLLRVGRNGK